MVADTTVKVSVLMITFNHERFVEQAVESVLEQEVSFPYELVIGEDCSTDNTRQILMKLQRRYPDKIRLLLPESNLGMHRNLEATLQACVGTYVALLEGDDYWTSRHKLQRQVQFLDAHPECAICFHAVDTQRDAGTEYAVQPAHRFEAGHFASLDELLIENFIPTCSVMFRRGLVTEFPEWVFRLQMADWPLHVLNALHGKIGYLDESMATYRVHSGGAWSQGRRMKRYAANALFYQQIEGLLEPRHQTIVRSMRSKKLFALASEYAKQGQRKPALAYIWQGWKAYPFNPRVSTLDLLKLGAKILAPDMCRRASNKSVEKRKTPMLGRLSRSRSYPRA